MKRTFYFLLAALAAVQSCSQKVDPESEEGLSAAETEIHFPKEGGSETVEIFPGGAGFIDAYASSSWIILSDVDPQTGSLTVSVDKTEEINDLSGEVVIYSDLDNTVRIKVTQDGNGIIYDRSSLELMNLHGKVKELSFYFDPAYVWEQNASYLYNLKFNEEGMLTHAEYFYLYITMQKINCFCDMEYDDRNRLVKMDVKTDGVVSMEDMTPFEFSISLEYGDHGKYIDTERIFAYLEDYNTWVWYRTWMPRMIKNLSKVTVYNNVTDPVEFNISIEVTGNEGKAYLNSGKEPQLLNAYTFEGDYTRTVDFMMNFLNIIYTDSRITFDTDPESGYITRLLQTSSTMGDIPIVDKTFGTELSNPLMYYREGLNYEYDMRIERNSNDDVSAVHESVHSLEAEYSYAYDKEGNWTSISSLALSPEATYPFETERTITYWE